METKNNNLIDNTKISYIENQKIDMNDILNKMNMGIGVFNCKNNQVVFMNNFFKSLVSRNGENFINDLWTHLKNFGNKCVDNLIIPGLIETEEGFNRKYGFSNYHISDDSQIIFLNEITSKTIATKTQIDNFLYDKMSGMIAEISHEIGNPLAGISTMLELLLSRFDDFSKEKSRNYLERTFDEINRLTKILRKIRSVYVDNKMELENSNLQTLINTIYEQNNEAFKNKGIKFTNDICEECFAIIDKVAFSQIIKNFFDNSLRILKPNQWINISAEVIGNQYIRMVYRNNGVSIPEESYEKIFLPLYSTREEGSGLGLFISLKLMTRMGGTIKIVKPENNEGVKFVLFIPRKRNEFKKKKN